MKVVIINKSDSTGGAAVVSFRLMEALREAGVDARMLVAEKRTDSQYVVQAAPPARLKHAFLTDRLDIFRSLKFNRRNLWKVDTGAYGVPLWRHPLVRHADVVCLNWVNQGFLSLKGVGKILSLGKPVVWTMHDMWNMTGVCHHAGDCNRFTHHCGECPLLGSAAAPEDLSNRIWHRKHDLYRNSKITFVAVSRWLASRAAASSLMHNADMRIIPNAFPIPKPVEENERESADGKVRIIMGAARLDDPIKGLPVLIKATRHLAADPQGVDYELLTYGSIKNSDALKEIAIPHRHLGILKGSDALRCAYMQADIVVSPSHYETLPGTLVEGQAFGCIPVAFDRGGQRDIIEHGKTGILVEYSEDEDEAAGCFAEGIRTAAAALSADRRREMRHSVIKKFAASSVASRYITLFTDLLNR